MYDRRLWLGGPPGREANYLCDRLRQRHPRSGACLSTNVYGPQP